MRGRIDHFSKFDRLVLEATALGSMQDGDHDDQHVVSHYIPTRRVTAQVGSNSTSSRSKPKSVLMERSVHIDDLKDLKFEDRSLSTVFTERQWTSILEAKGEVYSDLVLEFYKKLRESSGSGRSMCVHVRGARVVITPDTIASFLKLPRLYKDPQLDKVPRQDKHPKSSQWSANEIYHALTDTKDDVDRRMDEVISQKDLLPFFQMLHLIVAANVTPIEDTTELSIEQGKFLLDIVRGVDIDLPNHIFMSIQYSAQSFGSSKKGLPFGLLITGLILKAGVQIRSDEQGHQLPMEPIRWTKPISQTRPLAYPLTQQAGITSSSEDHDHHIRPPWFEAMLIEIDSRVAAQIAPIQSKLKDVEDRLQELRDMLIRDKLV